MASRPRPRPSSGSAREPLLLGCAAALVLCALAPTALAYRFAGPRWPNKTIAVASHAPRYERAIGTAIRAWNRARVGVRFSRVDDPTRARVVFHYASGRGGAPLGCVGIAGGTGAGYPNPLERLSVGVLRTCRSSALRRLTAAHELGHVLGLGHEDRHCALMNSTGNITTKRPSRCGPGPLVRRDDLRGARALYRRPAPRIDQSISLFNPRSGSLLPWRAEPISFSAAFRSRGLRYRWDFGDPASGAANRAEGPRAAHAFAAPGSYEVTLELRDGGTPIATRRATLELLAP